MSTFDRYKEQYTVNFKSGGDLTKDAFWKHIQEIHRIYGILNDLDANSVDSAAVTKAIDDAINKLKSTWKPSLTFNDISGTLDGSRLSGNISAALIKGALTNATIPSGNVTGLEGFVNGKISAIPTPPDKGDGLSRCTIGTRTSPSGYGVFKNGLIMEWGRSTFEATEHKGHINFSLPFPNACLLVVACIYLNDGEINGRQYAGTYNGFAVTEFNNNGFGFFSQIDTHDSNLTGYSGRFVNYVAIGY